MSRQSIPPSRAELVDEISNWAVGAGIITTALFPLALPILVLTAIAALPLLLPVLATGLLFGVIALPVLLVRGAIRALRPERRAERSRPAARPRSADSALAMGARSR